MKERNIKREVVKALQHMKCKNEKKWEMVREKVYNEKKEKERDCMKNSKIGKTERKQERKKKKVTVNRGRRGRQNHKNKRSK